MPFNSISLWRPFREHPVRDRRMPIPQVQKKGKKSKVCELTQIIHLFTLSHNFLSSVNILNNIKLYYYNYII